MRLSLNGLAKLISISFLPRICLREEWAFRSVLLERSLLLGHSMLAWHSGHRHVFQNAQRHNPKKKKERKRRIDEDLSHLRELFEPVRCCRRVKRDL